MFGYNASGEYLAPGRLWTFRLGGERDIVPVSGIERPALTAIEFTATADELALGADRYASRCAMCHGGNAASGGVIADLRYSAEPTFDFFEVIVRQGALTALGMPNLGAFLTGTEVEAIKKYVLTQRAALLGEQGDR
jgi:quinohemoprotein ethanol dehydrogenase